MTNKQKMLELVKKHLDINYEYLTPFGFEVKLEKIVETIYDLSYKVYVLEDEIKDLKKNLKNK